MYIETSDPAYKTSLFNAIVAPRPIGWISTLDETGAPNLAPFSYFNGMSATPPMVMFACNQPADRDEKDTLNNVRRTGEFVANLATYALREEMNGSSATVPHGVDEFELVGLAKGTSQCVKPPRVAASPVAMECRLLRVVDFEPEAAGERRSSVVFGRVLAMHIDDAYLDEAGRFNMLKARPLARLGGFTYLAVGDVFEMGRPKAAAG
jgi:flavin reductase (DIM6/NTAB) family NADH-FMN oxidoreductase RutF